MTIEHSQNNSYPNQQFRRLLRMVHIMRQAQQDLFRDQNPDGMFHVVLRNGFWIEPLGAVTSFEIMPPDAATENPTSDVLRLMCADKFEIGMITFHNGQIRP